MSQRLTPVQVLLLVFSLMGSLETRGAALPRGEGNWFVAMDLRYQKADEYWDFSGDIHDLKLEFSKLELALYAEYGWNAKNTLVFKGAYAFAAPRLPGTTRLRFALHGGQRKHKPP